MRRTIQRGAVAAIGLVGLLAACATTVPPEPPGVTLVDLEIEDATLFETTISASLRVANPNPDTLAISGGSLRLELNGRRIGAGMIPDACEIQPFTSHVVAATFHLDNASALLQLREILEAKTLSYGLSGQLYATGPRGRLRLPVSRSGTLDLRRLGGPLGPVP